MSSVDFASSASCQSSEQGKTAGRIEEDTGEQEHEPTQIETEDEVAQQEHEVLIVEGAEPDDEDEHVLDDDEREQTVTRKQSDPTVSDTIIAERLIKEEPPVTIAVPTAAVDQAGDTEAAILALIGELQSLKEQMMQSCQAAQLVARVIDRKILQVIEAF